MQRSYRNRVDDGQSAVGASYSQQLLKQRYLSSAPVGTQTDMQTDTGWLAGRSVSRLRCYDGQLLIHRQHQFKR